MRRTSASAHLIDLNSGNADQLTDLGLSAETKDRSTESRPYRSKLELLSRMILSQDEYAAITDRVHDCRGERVGQNRIKTSVTGEVIGQEKQERAALVKKTRDLILELRVRRSDQQAIPRATTERRRRATSDRWGPSRANHRSRHPDFGQPKLPLKANPRGPVLLEDFILREKITHFDHERIPERVVHAGGPEHPWFFRADARH